MCASDLPPQMFATVALGQIKMLKSLAGSAGKALELPVVPASFDLDLTSPKPAKRSHKKQRSASPPRRAPGF